MRPTVFQFEADITTWIVLEGLRRAGPGANREKLGQALDTLKGFDRGGFPVDFSPGKHAAPRFVEIRIIGRDCRLIF